MKRQVRETGPHVGGRLRRPLAERFWERVERGDGCWLWTGRLDSAGYGRICEGGWRGKSLLASRVAWMLAHGEMPPREVCVCHRCDNPRCVRVEHLFLGSHADNAADRVAKGRQAIAHGTAVVGALLDDQKVLDIRARARLGERHASIAAAYGVAVPTIRSVVYRQTWRHVGDAA